MGVKGLWQLLEPAGRRINIEALQNKKLAVDASIWLFQFVKAMRDDRGEPLHGAVVAGFFRRICRLLYHRIRPVFVFDGTTPALKKQTVAARRRRRERQNVQLSKIAQKLLINQLKQHALGSVSASQIKRAAAAATAAVDGSGQPAGEQASAAGPSGAVASEGAAPAEAAGAAEAADGLVGEPEVIEIQDSEDEAEAAARRRKGKAPLLEPVEDDAAAAEAEAEAAAAAAAVRRSRQLREGEGPSGASTAAAAGGAEDVTADELLAVQLTAMEWEEGGPDAAADAALAAAVAAADGGAAPAAPSLFVSRSQVRRQQQAAQGGSDEEEEGEEELVLPEEGGLDPAVLSTLPPSLALDLMGRMRERQQAANRSQFEARAAAPASFSQFQMQQYLAASQFRRKVEEVKDALNATAAGGSGARRIAGEAGREYVLHKEPAVEDEAAALAARHAPQPQAAEGRLAGQGHGTAARQEPPASSAAAATAAGHGTSSAPAGAVGAAAEPAVDGAPHGVLDICFEVGLGDSEGEGDLDWEDVDVGAEQLQQAEQPQHWRERAAARQRYWSLSHGFQMGRKLAAWGEQEEQGQAGEQAGRQEAPAAPAAAAGAGGGLASTPPRKKGLIARSPPNSRSPARQVPEDEDAQLQEAIRLSLMPDKVNASFVPDLGGPGPSPGGAAAAADASLAAAAARLLERRRELQQQAQQPQQAEQRQPEQLGTAVVDLTAAADSVPGSHAAALPPNSAGEAGSSDDEADALVRGVAAAAENSLEAPQPASALLASVNCQSAQRLEEWLGGSSGADAAGGQQAAEPASLGGPGSGRQTLGVSNAALVAEAAEAAVAVAAAEADEDGLEWEDAEAVASSVQDVAAVLAVAVQRAPAAAVKVAAGVKSVADAAPQAAAEPLGTVVAAASMEAAVMPVEAQQDVQQLPPPQQQEQAAPQGAAAVPVGAVAPSRPALLPQLVAGKVAQAAAGSRAPQPVAAPGAMPAKQVRFASAVQVRTLAAEQTADQAVPVAAEEEDGLEWEDTEAPAAATRSPAGASAVQAAAAAAAEQQQASPLAPEQQAAEAAAPLPPAPAPSPPAAAAGPAAALGGYSAAELAELAAMEDGEAAWQEQRPAAAAGAAGAEAAEVAEAGNAWGPAGQPVDASATMEELQAEERRLRAEQRAARGQADTPTTDMYQDCMELLTMFGVPYIIAPQEAEAQCAWLDANGLVDGVVTDDNDAFLFGARRVYRHIFEDKKYAEEYRADDLEAMIGLDRPKLMALAQLLGGDYCEGVAGVGVVNAAEIVSAFRGPDGLRSFRSWLDAPDDELVRLARGTSGRGKRGGGGKKGGRRGSKQQGAGAAGGPAADASPEGQEAGEGEAGSGEEEEEQEGAAAADDAALAEFKRKHRNVRRSWDAPASFPSAAVEQAYSQPKVDASKDKFTFGRPDVELLRQFCAAKFGWEPKYAEQQLVPVVRAYDQRQSQLTLDSFVATSQRFAKIKSKRLQKAVAGIAGGARDDLMLHDGEEGQAPATQPAGSKKRGGGRKRKAAQQAGAEAAGGAEGAGDGAGQQEGQQVQPHEQEPGGDQQQQGQQAQQQQGQQPQQVWREGEGWVTPGKRRRRQQPASGGRGGRGRSTAGRGRGRGRGRSGGGRAKEVK